MYSPKFLLPKFLLPFFPGGDELIQNTVKAYYNIAQNDMQ